MKKNPIVDGVDTRSDLPEDFKGERPTEEEIEKLNDNGIHDPFEKCVGCDDFFIDILREDKRGYQLEESRYSDKKQGNVCGACLETNDDYANTVVIYDPAKGEVHRWTVGEYKDDDYGATGFDKDDEPPMKGIPGEDFLDDNEKCPIQFSTHPIDGWRSYQSAEAPEGWIELRDDCILSGSSDADALEDFNGEMTKLLWHEGIKFAVCIGKTSNLFSQTYDLLAKMPEDQVKMLLVALKVKMAVEKYRDDARFNRTAITGSDEDTVEARRMVRAWEIIEESPDTTYMEVAAAVLAEVPE